jgi:hypothetical protein
MSMQHGKAAGQLCLLGACQWPKQVMRSLKLLALHYICLPISINLIELACKSSNLQLCKTHAHIVHACIVHVPVQFLPSTDYSRRCPDC